MAWAIPEKKFSFGPNYGKKRPKPEVEPQPIDPVTEAIGNHIEKPIKRVSKPKLNPKPLPAVIPPEDIQIQIQSTRCSGTSYVKLKKVLLDMLDNVGADIGERRLWGMRPLRATCYDNGIDPDIMPDHIDFDRDLRCPNHAILGWHSCSSHGGDDPRVKKAIQAAIVSRADDMVETLTDVAENGDKDSARVSAANSLLDRGGFKTPQEIKVEHTDAAQVIEDLSVLSDRDLADYIRIKESLMCKPIDVTTREVRQGEDGEVRLIEGGDV